MWQRIWAMFAGLFAGGITVMCIQFISSMIYKMPEGLDPSDNEAMSKWISELPIGAFLWVLLAWGCGSFIGAFIARRLAPAQSAIPGLIVWLFFLAATLFTLFSITHPVWFWFAGPMVCVVGGLLGIVFAAPKSYLVTSRRTISAPIDKVFATLASIDQFSKAVPHITNVEFLTDEKYGVGTRFRETRVINGREASTTIEVTELKENESVRMVSDEGGTIWDTIFRVKQKGEEVEMNMQMDAIPHKFPAKIITPMILGMVNKFVQQDMDSLKSFCEATEEN